LGNYIYILAINPISFEKGSWILPSIIYKFIFFLAIQSNLVLEFYKARSGFSYLNRNQW